MRTSIAVALTSVAFAACGWSCHRSPGSPAGVADGATDAVATRLSEGAGGATVSVPDRLVEEVVPRPAPRAPRANSDALTAAPADVSAERLALQVVDGHERLVDAEGARSAGLTLVDFSDDWAPAIFADGTHANGTPLPNRYRNVFVGLANDRADGDGQPLTAGEKNYLELLGVPPSLSVLRARVLHDGPRACADVDRAKLLAVQEIPTWGATTEQKEMLRHEARGKRLELLRQKIGARDWSALVTHPGLEPKIAREIKAHGQFAAEREAFTQVEKRVACEGLLALTARHKPGRYDTAMRAAVYNFQQKHMVLAQGDLNRATLEALARRPLELDFAAFRRVISERAAHAGAILEDGSVGASQVEAPTYLTDDGQRRPVPDLVSAATDAVLAALDIVTPEEAFVFFQRHTAKDFEHLRVAARFPALPPYYEAGQPMDLSAEIDRGDIWYDFPFDAKGNRVPQPRERYPSFTLFVKWKGERVPLVRWRTTVGGWRSELASDGQEYYAFKISDVGARVWRHIVAAPVWLPPASSPLGSMVKEKRVNGAFVNVTNYDETGPGYQSAYGLVAAIHEQVRRGPDGNVFSDNGIRTHGSFDYLSLRGRFSHGCHRLYNNLAVRLFSFVMAHRKVRTLGPMALNFRRIFWWGGELFDLRLPTRGFYFELTPPLPIQTLEGRIRGERQTPVLGYLRKPGVTYVAEKPPVLTDSPESKAAGGSEP